MRGLAAAGVVLGLFVDATLATQVAVDAQAVGYVRRVPDATYRHYAQEEHLTGSQGNSLIQTDSNSYFIFDLSSVPGTILSATFRVYTSNPRDDAPEGGYWSSDASEEFQLHEVATPPATIVNFPTTQFFVGSPEYDALDAIFADLGSGPLAGSVVMNEAEAEAAPGVVPGQPGGKIWDVELSPAAITSLNSASGLWAVGGSLADVTPPISTTTELLFSGSLPFSSDAQRATPKPQLILTTVTGAAADFDGNGLVDGADLLRWQRGLGLTGQSNNSTGDATGDGTVDGDDLAVWTQSFGTPSAAPSFSAVPEPCLCAMAIAGILAVQVRGFRRC